MTGIGGTTVEMIDHPAMMTVHLHAVVMTAAVPMTASATKSGNAVVRRTESGGDRKNTSVNSELR